MQVQLAPRWHFLDTVKLYIELPWVYLHLEQAAPQSTLAQIAGISQKQLSSQSDFVCKRLESQMFFVLFLFLARNLPKKIKRKLMNLIIWRCKPDWYTACPFSVTAWHQYPVVPLVVASECTVMNVFNVPYQPRGSYGVKVSISLLCSFLLCDFAPHEIFLWNPMLIISAHGDLLHVLAGRPADQLPETDTVRWDKWYRCGTGTKSEHRWCHPPWSQRAGHTHVSVLFLACSGFHPVSCM